MEKEAGMMNKWVKRKWVKALRSGEYEQGRRFLFRTVQAPFKTRYCCLGVLAAEMVPEFIRPDGRNLAVDGYTSILPGDLAIMYGLDEKTQDHLADMNDVGDDFCTIADWIEENL